MTYSFEYLGPRAESVKRMVSEEQEVEAPQTAVEPAETPAETPAVPRWRIIGGQDFNESILNRLYMHLQNQKPSFFLG